MRFIFKFILIPLWLCNAVDEQLLTFLIIFSWICIYIYNCGKGRRENGPKKWKPCFVCLYCKMYSMRKFFFSILFSMQCCISPFFTNNYSRQKYITPILSQDAVTKFKRLLQSRIIFRLVRHCQVFVLICIHSMVVEKRWNWMHYVGFCGSFCSMICCLFICLFCVAIWRF